MIHGKPRILCFGEVLWDCLPDQRLPGGAPLNVAYHLHQLGCDAQIISAVGCDAAGDEMLLYLEGLGLSVEYISRNETLPTGAVTIALSAGQPSYVIQSGVAWDDIGCSEAVLRAAAEADAIVYGSLAARSAANRESLKKLLSIRGPLRMMDINLRAPFYDQARLLWLVGEADWLKLNEEELAELGGIETLISSTGCRHYCITRGADGASIWVDGRSFSASAPLVKVRDTIGAGDAFTAAMVHGLVSDDSAAGLQNALNKACRLGALIASLPGAQPLYSGAEIDWIRFH